MFGMDLKIILIGVFGLIGWGFAMFVYSKFTKSDKEVGKLTEQKNTLRSLISKEIEHRYHNEISELKRYQTQYLVHMEERDKILSSLATLIKTK